MENENLASWLRGPIGRTSLESQFDTTVSFRKRTYPIVIEYLPIQMQIENESFLRNVENGNNLPMNSLATIRWIKPPLHRKNDQRKAFALLQVIEVETANNILHDGLCIDNERFSIHKDKKEPIRCAKCQHYGHIARNCTASYDTCATCSDNHRTTQCNAFRTQRCANCNKGGHTSWSRSCPEFVHRCEKLNDKYPENRMPYFPTEEIWTHASQPPRPISTTRSQSPHPTTSDPPQTNRTHNTRQTTLTFNRTSTPPQTRTRPHPRPRPHPHSHPHSRSRSRSPQRPQSPSAINAINAINAADGLLSSFNDVSNPPTDRNPPTPSNV
jgi:hypothetical protein